MMVFLINFHSSVKETYMDEIYKMTQNVVKEIIIIALNGGMGMWFASSSTMISAIKYLQNKKQR